MRRRSSKWPERSISGRMTRDRRPGLRVRIGDLVGDVDRLLDRVGDEDHRLLLVREKAQEILLELAPVLLVDRGERLVHEQDLGVDRERPGESDALAHAARQLVRIFVLGAEQADLGDVLAGDLLALLLRHMAQLEAECDVAQDRGPGQQREILEHESSLGAWARNRPAVDQHLALGRLEQAGDDLERGRLAAAGRPQQGRQLTAWKVEVDVPPGHGNRRTSCRPRAAARRARPSSAAGWARPT